MNTKTVIMIGGGVAVLLCVLAIAYFFLRSSPEPVTTTSETEAKATASSKASGSAGASSPADPAAFTGSLTGCEGNGTTFSCPTGKTLTAATVKYGRWNNNECPHSTVQPGTGISYTTKELDVAGKSTYSVPGDLNTFVGKDPFPSVYKHYQVDYTCV